MKNHLFILLICFMIFESCTIENVELSFNTVDFEGVYIAELDCNDALEDHFGNEVDITIASRPGALYFIEFDDDVLLEARRMGNALLLKDQELVLGNSKEVSILNGQIRDGNFDNLRFEYKIVEQGEVSASCLLDLEREF